MLALLLVLPLVATAVNAPLSPQSRTVTLAPFTTLSMQLVPDMGTRFVFPFVLDEVSSDVPFTLTVTNDAVFHVERPTGRNFFIVTVPPPADGGRMPDYLGTLFVNVAGYNLSVILKTTNDLRQHYTDVRFELDEAARADLVETAVAQKLAALEQDYQRKRAQLDTRAELVAMERLGQLVLQRPERIRIKEEHRASLRNKDDVVLYVDEAVVMAPYTVYVFDIENHDGTPLDLAAATLRARDPNDETETLIATSERLPETVAPHTTVRATLVTKTRAVPPKAYLTLSVDTAAGEVAATW
jgi:hypothetical protein